ncbi:hypothetical protein [Actinomadura parmotrematis]|uniref:SH3 domain-containing protein n=1 Tax=Actinomadura parmotrematis TaxID=2864039 RepID=A0ABS7G171_9ACTN|nr:hypothetical protein [Actinomadura parmotrematis]MBW8486438.1 hypothetical protein [Actinomadura parmotrematis]
MRKTIATTALLVALGGIAAGAASAAEAAAAPKPPKPAPGDVKVAKNGADLPGRQSLKSGGVSSKHVSGVDSVWHNAYEWTANVRIDSGSNGAWTECSDGSVHYGPRVGPGYWKFGGNCYGYGTLTDFGIYGD